MRFALIAVIAFALGSGHQTSTAEPMAWVEAPDVDGRAYGLDPHIALGSGQAALLEDAVSPDRARLGYSGKTEASSKSAEPKADNYIAHLEKERLIYRRGWLKRGRVIRAQRQIFRRSLYASPVGNHWLENAFLCIKQHEGAWSSATGNGFYGGLQMDRSFQRSYGSEYASLGAANRWPRSVQIAVAIEAYLSGRGFGPWPNTRRLCGL